MSRTRRHPARPKGRRLNRGNERVRVRNTLANGGWDTMPTTLPTRAFRSR